MKKKKTKHEEPARPLSRNTARAREAARTRNIANLWSAIAELRARCGSIESAVAQLQALAHAPEGGQP